MRGVWICKNINVILRHGTNNDDDDQQDENQGGLRYACYVTNDKGY